MLSKTDLSDWTYGDHLIGFGADGASVNFGKHNSVYQKLHEEMPWLMGVHCIAHRLELAAKDAFRNTYFTNEVSLETLGFSLDINLLSFTANMNSLLISKLQA